jgi:hypothetical protein
MARGLLASLRPTATTETVLYTVPASTQAMVNVYAMNMIGTTAAKIRVGVQDTAGAFASKDYRFYDFVLDVTGGPVELMTGVPLDADQSIRVYTDVATVNFHVDGCEETAS